MTEIKLAGAGQEEVEQSSNAKIFPLGNGHFSTGLGIGKLYAFAILKRPRDFGNLLFEFQKAAVKIAAMLSHRQWRSFAR